MSPAAADARAPADRASGGQHALALGPALAAAVLVSLHAPATFFPA
jgi:hypothetical protein